MKPITYFYLALLVMLIGGKIYMTTRRKKVCFMHIHSDSLPDGFLNAICPQLNSMGIPVSSQKMSDALSPIEVDIQAIAENADPDISNPAVLYIEDYNIVLVSLSVVARIVRGDKWLLRKVARWTESFEDAFVVVANFGFFRYQ